ncbi:MAG TPA: glycerophosphodiester phosphodiesterase [Alphaproteobacteria bacterium]|nr:glycerophosphodiester phosphodiesterase [Alphaproteobacteria bacterium]
MRFAAALLLGALALPLPALAEPLVIGHRGASGYLPEHTLAAYDLAIEMGADYIEPDLVMTKDGILIARHENEIGGTTDVAQKFPDRKTKKTIDGVEMEGWFTEDFTLAEIKTLRARERTDFRNQALNGFYPVPTLQEVIDLAKRKGAEKGRTIGLYPETKHPTYFDSVGLSLEEPLVMTLKANGYLDRTAPVFIQSFEVGNLKQLAKLTDIRLVQLFDEKTAQPYDIAKAGGKTTYADMMTPAGLAEIAGYAQGIGPWKRLIVEENPDGTLKPANTLIADAHKAGLLVHAYTFRSEDRYLAPEYGRDPVAEYRQFYRLGLDGVFSDHPDAAVRAKRAD